VCGVVRLRGAAQTPDQSRQVAPRDLSRPLCKPEVTGSIPVRSTPLKPAPRAGLRPQESSGPRSAASNHRALPEPNEVIVEPLRPVTASRQPRPNARDKSTENTLQNGRQAEDLFARFTA
jgi:hypothetical protein